jgi:hypothetical protein
MASRTDRMMSSASGEEATFSFVFAIVSGDGMLASEQQGRC